MFSSTNKNYIPKFIYMHTYIYIYLFTSSFLIMPYYLVEILITSIFIYTHFLCFLFSFIIFLSCSFLNKKEEPLLKERKTVNSMKITLEVSLEWASKYFYHFFYKSGHKTDNKINPYSVLHVYRYKHLSLQIHTCFAINE